MKKVLVMAMVVLSLSVLTGTALANPNGPIVPFSRTYTGK